MPPRPIDRAAGLYGVEEHNPLIKEYLANGGINLSPAEQAWCAAYVGATLKQSGYDIPKNPLGARSYLNLPGAEDVLTPREGDVVVAARNPHDPDPAAGSKGHAGFFRGYDPETGNNIVLGGNTSQMVADASIPQDRILGYRRPKEALPDILATAVSPELNQAIDSTRLKAPGNTAEDRMYPHTSMWTGKVAVPDLADIFRVKPIQSDPNLLALGGLANSGRI